MIVLLAFTAQAADADSYEISDGRYDHTGVFQLATPLLGDPDTWYAGLDAAYADGPLTFTRPDGEVVRVVGAQSSTRAAVGVNVGGRMRVHGEVPVYPMLTVEGEQRSALGDIRMASTVPFMALGPVSLAAVPDVVLPSGSSDAFVSNGGAAGVTVAAGAEHGALGWVANLGAEGAIGSELSPGVRLGSGLDWGAGAHMRVDALVAGLELEGRTPLTSGLGGDGPLEAHAYGLYDLGPWQANLGLGTGLVAGIGAPAVRVVAGVGYRGKAAERDPNAEKTAKKKKRDKSRTPGDRDGDGVLDEVDLCKNLPGPKMYDGCPDTDGDQVLDVDDKCPNMPGSFETMGCPDGDNPWGAAKPDEAKTEEAKPDAPEADEPKPDATEPNAP